MRYLFFVSTQKKDSSEVNVVLKKYNLIYIKSNICESIRKY